MLSAGTRSAHHELEQKLRPFVARRVPAADIEDVLQDVFLRVQQGLSRLRDQERFVPWLYQVARSAVQENLRQRARHPLASSADEPELPEGDDADFSDSGLATYAASAIGRLPSPYREALTLTELQGLTQEAAAKALGISVSGMKSRVQRGRERLRSLIEECCAIALDVRGRVIDCEPRQASACQCAKPER